MSKINLQIRVPIADAVAWRQSARALGVTVGQFICLSMKGALHTAPVAAPVEEKTVEAKPLIRERIAATMGHALKKREIPALARKLGVPARSVHSSLGSMVASKVLVKTGDEYRRV